MTLLNDIQNLQTPAKTLLMGFYEALSDMLEVPNSVLPSHLHGRYNGRSVTELTRKPKLSKKEFATIELENVKTEKELRIAGYSLDGMSEKNIQYLEDEHRLYRNQITFANLLGIEFDD